MPVVHDKSVRAEWQLGWASPKAQTVSEWADENFYLRRELSAFPGRYRTERMPYLAGIMDAYADPFIDTIVVPKSAQIGLTTVADIMLAWSASQDPGPMMYVYPTEANVRYAVQNRLAPLFEMPGLSDLKPYDGFATNDQIDLRGGTTIFMAWAGAPNTMTTKPAAKVFFDELSNCDAQAGALGDNYALVSERKTAFVNRSKIMAFSTLNSENDSLWKLWLLSDQRHYYVPCPLCGFYQKLLFDRIRIPEGVRDPQIIEIKNLAWYECAGCGGKLDDSKHKHWMNLRGLWIPRGQEPVERLDVEDPDQVQDAHFRAPKRWTPRIEGEAPLTRIAGFRPWSAYSRFRKWSLIAATFLKSKDDRGQLKVFVNSWLGEPFSETAEELQEVPFAAKREGGLPRGVVPDAALCIIVSADVQKNRIYYVVRAWGVERRSWLIEEGIVADLDELLAVALRQYPRIKEPKQTIQADWLAIDSGYRTFEIYDFARTYPGIMAMKGKDTAQLPVFETNIEYVPQTKREMVKVKLYHVDTSFFKEQLVYMVANPTGQPGEWNLNRDTSLEYCKQVTSEHQTWVNVKRNNRKVRIKKWDTKREGADNHFLDCEVYNLAAAHHQGILRAMPTTSAPPLPPPEPRPQYGKSKMGWSLRPTGRKNS